MLSGDLATHYLVETDKIESAVWHHLSNVLWEFARRDPEKPFSPLLAEFQDYDEERNVQQIQVPDAKKRKKIHKIGMEYLLDCRDPQAVTDVFLPFYQSFWRGMLIDGEMFEALHQVTEAIGAVLSDDRDLMFDFAYSLHKRGLLDQAEEAYRKLLAVDVENVPTLHNLSLALSEKGKVGEALELSDRALALAPDDSVVADLNGSLRERASGQKRDQPQVEQRQVEQPQPAQPEEARPQVEPPTDELPALPGEKTDGPELPHPTDGRMLVTKVIQAQAAPVAKPIFNSPREKMVYDLLTGLFPNYLVFPNMACNTIFDYEGMKQLIGEDDDFRHFLMAIVDFCVVSTTDYRPMVAFEVDSSYHDSPEQMEKDGLKDKIFHLGGVPLIRLRPKVQQSDPEMKREIIHAVQQAQVGFESV
jgi:hypothetical protein